MAHHTSGYDRPLRRLRSEALIRLAATAAAGRGWQRRARAERQYHPRAVGGTAAAAAADPVGCRPARGFSPMLGRKVELIALDASSKVTADLRGPRCRQAPLARRNTSIAIEEGAPVWGPATGWHRAPSYWLALGEAYPVGASAFSKSDFAV